MHHSDEMPECTYPACDCNHGYDCPLQTPCIKQELWEEDRKRKEEERRLRLEDDDHMWDDPTSLDPEEGTSQSAPSDYINDLR